MVRLIAILAILTTPAFSQQNVALAQHEKPHMGEPDLPVVVDHACPFEGCTFREWSVEKDSIVYSSWQENRTQVGTLKTGEKVQGITGVYITRQPDRFLVTQPIPPLSLKVGDVVLQYGEWGEGAADLWADGQLYKSFDWGSTDDGHLILTDENLHLVRRGIKEWWVQVKRADGQTCWAIVGDNFGNMDQLGDAPEEKSQSLSSEAVEVPEPELPVLTEDVCPGKNHTIAHWKIAKEAPMYNSWVSDRSQVGPTMWVGQEVTIIGSMYVVFEPDRVLVTKPIADLSLKTDDVLLRYAYYSEGIADVWAKGVWHKRYYLSATEAKGGGCQSDCNSVVIKNGVKEWWVQITNSSGNTGWVMSLRLNHDDFWDDGNFANLCGD